MRDVLSFAEQLSTAEQSFAVWDALRLALEVSDQRLLAMQRELWRIRLLDEMMQKLQRQGRIGFYGACTGQEAVPVGVGFALSDQDWVFPALRESAVMLVRGFPLERYLAQLFGNGLDVLKGRQMPSHMSARSVRQVSWSSAIGTQLTHAVGAAFAAKLRGEPLSVIGFLGDGATSTADFHAALNFAAVYRVPCVFVCQNNQYAISVPVARQTRVTTLADKAKSYGMLGVSVDGNDVLAVYGAVSALRERAVREHEPALLECVTYRMGAHSSSDDPSRYRSDQELEQWRARDPLLRFGAELRRVGLSDAERERALVKSLSDELSEAVKCAEAAPPVPRASLFEDVYAQMPWHLEEQARSVQGG